jgi:NADH-quinone oxidoreductase subunit M
LPEGWQWTLRLGAVLAVTGVVLGAWYMLWLVQRLFFGPVREPHVGSAEVVDLSWREILALTPLAVLIVWIGIQPHPFLERMQSSLNPVAARVERSLRAQAIGLQQVASELPSMKQEAAVRVR